MIKRTLTAESVTQRLKPPPVGFHLGPMNRLHHWQAGPGRIAVPLAKPYRRGGVKITHRVRWYLDRVEGTTKATALTAIYLVLNDPRGWWRSGVAFSRTFDRAAATVELSVIPMANTLCGAGAAGCFCDGCRTKPDGSPLAAAECAAEYVTDPYLFAAVLNMEIGLHAAFSGLDMYVQAEQPYQHGVAGNWSDNAINGGFPTDEEVVWAREWLDGKVAPQFIHAG